jgi:iron complex outermembrane receptor protein
MSTASQRPAITRRVLAVAIATSLSDATCPTWAEAPGTADKVDSDTISVTASRIERTTREVPTAIAVVDGKRIDQAPMMNVKDAIQGTPGVLIDSKNGGYDVRLVIRGAGQEANYGVREIIKSDRLLAARPDRGVHRPAGYRPRTRGGPVHNLLPWRQRCE